MKLLLSAAAAALVLAGASSALAAVTQATQSVSATATVVTPLTESVTQNISFGKLVMNNTNALGTIVLSQTGGRTATGGVDLVASSPTAAIVHFVGDTTNGAPNPYNVSIDSSTSLSDGASHTMTVDGIGTTDTITGITGTNDIHIGATLHAAAGQTAGTYTGSFNVTANYQ